MAIEIKMPKEINKYEAKAVGMFSMRQLLCLFICMPICVGLFILVKPYVGTDIAGFVVIPPAAVGWLFGWYKPYGMKFEKYMKTVFVNSFLAPTKRLYKTENYYAGILKEIEKEEEAEALRALEEATGKKAKPRSEKKKKYKRSKLAIK